MKIEIEQDDRTGWNVRCGDRYENHLGWDEALGVIAAILIRPNNVPYLKTKEQHDAWDEQCKRPPKEVEATPQRETLEGE